MDIRMEQDLGQHLGQGVLQNGEIVEALGIVGYQKLSFFIIAHAHVRRLTNQN